MKKDTNSKKMYPKVPANTTGLTPFVNTIKTGPTEPVLVNNNTTDQFE